MPFILIAGQVAEQRACQIHSAYLLSNASPALYLAFELGWSQWKLAFASAPADAARLRTLRARDNTATEDQ